MVLLILVLLRLEQSDGSAGIDLNKATADPIWKRRRQDLLVPPAGRGGEGGIILLLLRSAAEALLAGRGGEGESGFSRSLDAPVLGSRFVGDNVLSCGLSMFSSFCCGCKTGRSHGVCLLCCRCCLLHIECFLELIHAVGVRATAILCRHGGVISTSKTEAILCISCWSSTSCCRQVVCPRRLQGGQWSWCFAGRGCPSASVLFLGGDAWRMPANHGRGTVELVYFSIFSSRVCFANVQALSSNIQVLCTRVVIGSACIMYLPYA